MSADNSILLTKDKELLATDKKIEDSNNQLALAGPHGSMIRLNKNGDGKGPGNEFFNVIPGINTSAYHNRVNSMPSSFHKGIQKQKENKPLEIWADCRRASELVTGASSGVSLMDRKVKIGNELSEGYSGKLVGIGNGNDSNTARLSMQVYATQIGPFLEKKGVKESLSLAKLKKAFDDEKITYKFVGEILPYALDNLVISKNLYASLTPEALDDFHKETATNEYANPEIGDAYSTVTEFGMPGFKESGNDWAFHWGGVVMKGGSDNVTLENLSVSDETVKNSNWFFSMYGTVDKKQSFHARQTGTGHHGNIATTITAVTLGSTENRKLQSLKEEISNLKKLEVLNGADERDKLLKTAIDYNKLADSLGKPMLSEYEIFLNPDREFTSESKGKVHTLNKRYIPI